MGCRYSSLSLPCQEAVGLEPNSRVLLGRFGIVPSDGGFFQRRSRFAGDQFQAARIRPLRDLLYFR